MLIAADQFDRIVSALGTHPAAQAAAASQSGGGQRQQPRVLLAARATVIPFTPGAEGLAGYDFPRGKNGSPQMPLGDPLSVPIRDLSRGGVRFLMPRRLPLDAPFVLLLSRPTGFGTAASDRPLAIECAVTYWQPVRRDLFAVGAQFRRSLDGFIAPPATPALVLPEFGAAVEAPMRRAV